MKVRNIHSRIYPVSASVLGEVLDTLASDNDQLWPNENWPPMRFENSLAVGSVGGHKPIRYSVEEYDPARRVVFRFISPAGFSGTHTFEINETGSTETELSHEINMNVHGSAVLLWSLIIRPLHNALLKDALSKVAKNLGVEVSTNEWSAWVKFLRWSFASGDRPRPVA